MLNDVQNGFGTYYTHEPRSVAYHELGNSSNKVYHDITDLAELTSLPLENHVHRDVEMAVLDAQKKFKVPTAILSPPTIHGVGKGPMKTRSIQIPFMTESVLKRGQGFQILEGQNIWDGKHDASIVIYFD